MSNDKQGALKGLFHLQIVEHTVRLHWILPFKVQLDKIMNPRLKNDSFFFYEIVCKPLLSYTFSVALVFVCLWCQCLRCSIEICTYKKRNAEFSQCVFGLCVHVSEGVCLSTLHSEMLLFLKIGLRYKQFSTAGSTHYMY